MKRTLPVLKGHGRQVASAFTLMEVMIAMGIFFIAVFAILELVATNLRNARALQQSQVDGGLAMAQVYANPLTEPGETNGDFGDLLPGYSWRADFEPEEDNGNERSNGLAHVTIFITDPKGKTERALDTFMWTNTFKTSALAKP